MENRTLTTDGYTLLAGGEGGILRAWDLNTGKETEIEGQKRGGIITRIVASSNAKSVFVGNSDSSIQIFST